MDACPNCGAPAGGRYCSACGQDNLRTRLSARALLTEALHNLFGWDSALARTLRGLVVDPGGMTADYVSGRRRRFVHPARFCLLALALWLVSARLLGVDPLESMGVRIHTTGEEQVDTTALTKAFLQRNLDLLLFLALPLRALLLRGMFRRADRNVAECLVLVFYLAGFGYLIGLLFLPLLILGGTWANAVRLSLQLAWFVRAVHGFFGRGWFASTWRALLVAFLHALATVLLFAAIALPWVVLVGS